MLDIPRLAATAAVLMPFLLLAGAIVYWKCSGAGFHHKAGGSVEVNGAALHLDGDRYGGPVPVRDLLLDQVELIRWNEQHELKLKWKTFGACLPGFYSGWFSLSDGRRALVFILAETVLMIPTRRDYILLLGVDDTDGLLLQLKAAQERPA